MYKSQAQCKLNLIHRWTFVFHQKVGKDTVGSVHQSKLPAVHLKFPYLQSISNLFYQYHHEMMNNSHGTQTLSLRLFQQVEKLMK